MPISAPQFAADYPEFADEAIYPPTKVSYWLSIAYTMLNPQRWPQRVGPGPVATGEFVFSANPQPGDTITLNGTELTFVAPNVAPGALQVQLALQLPQTLANLLAFLSLCTDANLCKASALTKYDATTQLGVLVIMSILNGVQGNAYTLAASSTAILPSGPTLTGGARGRSMYDIGIELYAAHNLVLEERNIIESAAGGTPGSQKGPISSTSVNGAAVSYDTGIGTIEDGGYFNLTTYGTRFLEMVRMVGMGPVQVGVGWTPPLVGGAWPGPPMGWSFVGGPI